MKYWILTNAPSPYQVELLRNFSSRADVSLSMRFMRKHNLATSPDLGEADVNYMSALAVSRTRDELRFHPSAIWECLRGEWDCYVLSGTMASPTFLLAAMMLWLRGKPWVLWLERPHPKSASAPWQSRWIYGGPVRFVRNWISKWLLKRCTGLIAMGSAAVNEYVDQGIDRVKVRSLPYCCDTERFQIADPEVNLNVRRQYELEDKLILLFSGQLIARKGIHQLLNLYQTCLAENSNLRLVILGEGNLRGAVEEFQQRFPGKVIAPGKRDQRELPAWFRAADIFLFPSRHDGWAVVINEAAAAGLPIIASSETGAAHDLIESGVNGWRINWDDTQGWQQKIAELSRDERLRQKMGAASKRMVANFSSQRGAARLEEHLAHFTISKTGLLSDREHSS